MTPTSAMREPPMTHLRPSFLPLTRKTSARLNGSCNIVRAATASEPLLPRPAPLSPRQEKPNEHQDREKH